MSYQPFGYWNDHFEVSSSGYFTERALWRSAAISGTTSKCEAKDVMNACNSEHISWVNSLWQSGLCAGRTVNWGLLPPCCSRKCRIKKCNSNQRTFVAPHHTLTQVFVKENSIQNTWIFFFFKTRNYRYICVKYLFCTAHLMVLYVKIKESRTAWIECMTNHNAY